MSTCYRLSKLHGANCHPWNPAVCLRTIAACIVGFGRTLCCAYHFFWDSTNGGRLAPTPTFLHGMLLWCERGRVINVLGVRPLCQTAKRTGAALCSKGETTLVPHCAHADRIELGACSWRFHADAFGGNKVDSEMFIFHLYLVVERVLACLFL